MLLLSRVRLFVTPWTVTLQVPLSMGFSRQEYRSRLPFPTLEDLSKAGIKPGSPALKADFFFLNHLGHQGSLSMRETQALLSAHLFHSVQLQCLIVFTLGLFLLAVFLSWMSFLKLHLKILSGTFGYGQRIDIFNQFETVCVLKMYR